MKYLLLATTLLFSHNLLASEQCAKELQTKICKKDVDSEVCKLNLTSNCQEILRRWPFIETIY